jgi:hypothetical protein
MVDNNRKYKMFLNSDGYLILTTIDDSKELWRSQKFKLKNFAPPYTFKISSSGKLVVFDSTKQAVFRTTTTQSTSSSSGFKLRL